MRRSAGMSAGAVRQERDSNSRSRDSSDAPRSSGATESTNSTFGVKGTRELGTIGNMRVTEDISGDLGSIIGPQKISGSINLTEQSAKGEVDLGIKKGFGVEFGGAVARTPNGVSFENISFGANVLGFGVTSRGNGNDSGELKLSVPGGSVSIANDKDGNTSFRLGFSLPGFDWGVTFQPNGVRKGVGEQPTTPSSLPPEQPATRWTPPGDINIDSVRGCTLKVSWREVHKRIDPYSLGCGYHIANSGYPYRNQRPDKVTVVTQTCREVSRPADRYGPTPFTLFAEGVFDCEKYWVIPLSSSQQFLNDVLGFIYFYIIPTSFVSYIRNYELPLVSQRTVNEPFITVFDCNPVKPNTNVYIPNSLLLILKDIAQDLPNLPQKYEPMNCCDKIEEIYKYLGIAKIKRQKFKVAKQFLAPGGSGTEDCEDYYQISQALFRMLANGLIINPISKPLGNPWKSVNATAWASEIYEMAAESMSNGDTTQKYEISAIMQSVQMMSAIAELSRKVDFISEVLGSTPDLDTEDLPVCFTIHESHKGFAKKDPKVIDVASAKTDNEVEAILGKMLQPSKVPIVKWVFKPDSISIAAALNRLN